MKANLLFFYTGSFKVPIEGIAVGCPLRINKAYSDKKNVRLPVAHTCSTAIDLPDYQDKDVLREKLVIAITEGREGLLITW